MIQRILCWIGLHIWGESEYLDTTKVYENEYYFKKNLPKRTESTYKRKCNECGRVGTYRVQL